MDEVFKNKNYRYENRELLKCTVYENLPIAENEKQISSFKKGKVKNVFHCLNEIVFDKGKSSKMLNFKIEMNDQSFPRILSDGLMFSTPSGSSGYNLSANGPLVNYEVKCFIMNALSAFTLSWRPLVYPQHFIVKLKNNTKEVMECVCDGRLRFPITKDDFAEISLSENEISFIYIDKFIDDSFKMWKEKLTDTLGWNKNIGY